MPAPAPAVTSPYGNGPGNLPPETPDVGGVGDLINGQTSVGKMSIPTPAAAPAGAPAGQPAPDANAAPPAADAKSVDDLFSQIDSLQKNPDQMSPMPAPQGWDSAKEQISEAATRFKNAFAVTGPESVSVLKNSGLFDDVRMSGKTVQVKRKGRGGWENFDRDKVELLGDTLDFARDAFEGIVENAFRAGGAAGGALAAAPEGVAAGAAAGTAVAPGPGTLAGAAAGGVATAAAGMVPGGIAGGAAGAVAAKNAGDLVAQKLLGIPRDPDRNMTTENATAAAMGAGFSFLGSKLARSKAAAESVAGEAKKTLQAATQRVSQATADVQEVLNSGIKLGENGKFRLDPQQAVGAGVIPELDVTAKQLSTEQSFRNFREHIGNSLQTAYDSVAKALGAQSGKSTAELADNFVLTAKDVRQVEGKLIGSFRSLADEKLAGQVQNAPQFVNTLQAMAQEIPKDASDFALSAGITTQQAKQVQSMIAGLTTRAQKAGGQFTVDEMQQLTSQLTGTINANMNSARGRPVAVKLIELRNAIRDDWTEAMGQVLPASYQDMYAQSKARYREMLSATDTLGKTLETENISKNELIGKLFEGKGSYKFAQSAKTLINETNPQLWDQLSGEYLTKLKQDATSNVTGAVDWGQISKKWGNLDPRLQDDIMTSTQIPKEGMDALLRLGTRVQGATFDALAKDTDKTAIKNTLKQVFTWWGGGATAKGNAAGSLIEGMGKDQAMAKWLQDGGMEEILKELPGMQPGKAAQLRSWIGNFTPEPVKAMAPTTARRRTEEALP